MLSSCVAVDPAEELREFPADDGGELAAEAGVAAGEPGGGGLAASAEEEEEEEEEKEEEEGGEGLALGRSSISPLESLLNTVSELARRYQYLSYSTYPHSQSSL